MAGRSSLLAGSCKTAFKDDLDLEPLLEVVWEDDLSFSRVDDGIAIQKNTCKAMQIEWKQRDVRFKSKSKSSRSMRSRRDMLGPVVWTIAFKWGCEWLAADIVARLNSVHTALIRRQARDWCNYYNQDQVTSATGLFCSYPKSDSNVQTFEINCHTVKMCPK